ncbi:MAG TPA: hypothetical protein VGO93_30825 [Candidatus Xenobia bacterium]|jgi:hypothetical protein
MRWFVCILLLGGIVMAAPGGLPARWPAPPGVHTETIPFPLDFAPQVAFHGIEEIRFAPGFRKPDAPDWFTYSFVWYVNDSRQLDVKADLTAYFRGLMDAVAKEDHLTTRAWPTWVEVGEVASGFTDEPTTHAVVHTWDAFGTPGPLTLDIQVYEPPCSVPDHRFYYFETTPHPHDPAVRHLLDRLRAAFDT